MRNLLHILTKKCLIAGALLCLSQIIFFTAFSQENTVGTGQEPKVYESWSGEKRQYHTVTTRYPDGTSVTYTYFVKIIDGKPFDVKIGYNKQTTDRETGIRISQDTVYWNDGVTISRISEYRYKPKVRENDSDTLLLMEQSSFDKMGVQESGWKRETGLDLKVREYKWNPKTQEYDLKETFGKGVQPISCPVPKATISMEGVFVDNAYEKIRQLGASLGASFYIPKKQEDPNLNPVDSLFSLYSSGSGSHTQVGIGATAIFVSGSDQDFKLNLSTLTVGPEIRFTKNIFSAALQLQGGVAKNGFKYGDYKDHENSFVLKTGLVIDCWFSNRVAVEAAPLALMTKFSDETKWSFGVGVGVAVKFGCGYK